MDLTNYDNIVKLEDPDFDDFLLKDIEDGYHNECKNNYINFMDKHDISQIVLHVHDNDNDNIDNDNDNIDNDNDNIDNDNIDNGVLLGTSDLTNCTNDNNKNNANNSIGNTFLSSNDKKNSSYNRNDILFENIDICCFCGKNYSEHKKFTHEFHPCKEKYKCKKCNKFFFQHNHSKTPCFQPYEYIKQ